MTIAPETILAVTTEIQTPDRFDVLYMIPQRSLLSTGSSLPTTVENRFRNRLRRRSRLRRRFRNHHRRRRVTPVYKFSFSNFQISTR